MFQYKVVKTPVIMSIVPPRLKVLTPFLRPSCRAFSTHQIVDYQTVHNQNLLPNCPIERKHMANRFQFPPTGGAKSACPKILFIAYFCNFKIVYCEAMSIYKIFMNPGIMYSLYLYIILQIFILEFISSPH